jgi:cation diffusion facilitator family transporter
MTSDSNLHKRALLLSYFSMAYNIIEFILSIIAGFLSNSIALIGFGLDSLVESLSAGIMIWRFRKHGRISKEEEERIEKKAEKLVGYTFLILAAYILYESIDKLVTSEIPDPSLFGILIAAASLIIMPVLYYVKNRTGKEIGSKSLVADSKETLACTFLSVALLLGLGANYLFGFWQADPIVGFVIVLYLVREGIEIVKGENEET